MNKEFDLEIHLDNEEITFVSQVADVLIDSDVEILSDSVIQVTAVEDIEQFRFVTHQGKLGSYLSELYEDANVVGIQFYYESVGVGNTAFLQTEGTVFNPDWDLVIGDNVFLAEDGLIMQIVPAVRFNVLLGQAITEHEISLSIREPIKLRAGWV